MRVLNNIFVFSPLTNKYDFRTRSACNVMLSLVDWLPERCHLASSCVFGTYKNTPSPCPSSESLRRKTSVASQLEEDMKCKGGVMGLMHVCLPRRTYTDGFQIQLLRFEFLLHGDRGTATAVDVSFRESSLLLD